MYIILYRWSITISEHISLYNKLIEKEYSQEFGILAKEPEMMYKLLFSEIKDMLSDREVISREKTDMSYKYFLDLNLKMMFQVIACYRYLEIQK